MYEWCRLVVDIFIGTVYICLSWIVVYFVSINIVEIKGSRIG